MNLKGEHILVRIRLPKNSIYSLRFQCPSPVLDVVIYKWPTGEQTLKFALSQLTVTVQWHTRVHDRFEDTPNIVDLFIFSKASVILLNYPLHCVYSGINGNCLLDENTLSSNCLYFTCFKVLVQSRLFSCHSFTSPPASLYMTFHCSSFPWSPTVCWRS